MTTEIVPVSRIELALKEVNITDALITGLREDYMKLVVKDKNDKASYEIVRKARIEVKGYRVLAQKIAKKGREAAMLEQKAWIAAEKDVCFRLGEVENYLEQQEEIVSGAEKRKKADAELAEKAKQEEKDKQTKEIEDRFKKDYEGKLKEVKDAVRGVIYGK